MFDLLAKLIIKWKNDLKKRTTWQERVNKAWNSINQNEVHHYYHNATGTSSTKLDPEQEKRLWDTFDNSFRIMDNSFKIMDNSFRHMDDFFKDGKDGDK
jgi:hypothetical protein